MTNKKCSAHVFDARGNSWSCQNPAKVEQDGKWYCHIHDPEYIKEKRAKREMKWEAELKARDEQWNWIKARDALVAGLTIEELNQLTPEILREVIHKGVKVL